MKKFLFVLLLLCVVSCKTDNDVIQYFPNAQIALLSLNGTYTYNVSSQTDGSVIERGGVIITAYSELVPKTTLDNLFIDVQGEMKITYQTLTSDTQKFYYIIIHPEENKIWAYERVESQPDKISRYATVFEYAMPDQHTLSLCNLTQNKSWIHYGRIISVTIK